jgi:hypothetical protein
MVVDDYEKEAAIRSNVPEFIWKLKKDDLFELFIYWAARSFNWKSLQEPERDLEEAMVYLKCIPSHFVLSLFQWSSQDVPKWSRLHSEWNRIMDEKSKKQ